MAIGASGAISIGNGGAGSNTINSEFGRSSNTANSSLQQLSNGTYGTITLTNLNANKPDTTAPHAMSEFYKYHHDVLPSTNNAFQSFGSSGGTGTTITVVHATYSTWYVSSKPSWVNITSGNFGSGNKDTGDGTVTFTVASNSGSSRSGSLVVTFDIGTFGGGVGDANSTTTMTTSITQSAGSGGGPGGGGPPPPGGGGKP